MILFRRAQAKDVDAIHQLAIHSGVGLTTLPKDKKMLQKRIAWSCESFDSPISEPRNEYYFFVLEDSRTGQVIGCSALESATGYSSPFYSYKVSRRTRFCHSLNIRSDYEVLSLVNDNQGRSELCTLFLEPAWRKDGNGLLLSRARFLYMARFPERFAPIVIAEMRGISDENGHSPFWDNLGRYFFQMEYVEADRLTLATDKQFIADLMPRNPVYVKLLKPEAQAVIGRTHPSTEAAMNILLNEGFRYNNYVDIFDAGPTIEAPFNQIRTVTSSQTMTIKNLSDDVGGHTYLVSNNQADFRATITQVVAGKSANTCVISKDVARLLQLSQGDQIRVSPLKESI
ncbi:arginine N-succinyltransferase [Legionella sp. CNM-4043-24]|uniref:arginine N-succinyltransferase n=1 Tax=Legionella sp. CNM-4043-24 TaxID=3421646 RepID=UPI00403B0056